MTFRTSDGHRKKSRRHRLNGGERQLVWFTCIPDVWLLRDADQNGKAERRQSLHRGYGVHTALLGHDMHGLRMGPDGKLYFSIGDRGLNVMTRESRRLTNTDSGAVLRCDLDGNGLEIFASGLRNPQELAFDRHGNLFTGDNNSDAGDKARLVYVAEGGDTRFLTVRFGNVLGSSGSVVPLFQEQVSRGGPLTVTDRGVARYFMTVEEAVRLVLQAGSLAQGGEVFVLDMGKPVPILKLARQVIETAGYTVRDEDNPDGDIEIEITGLRPGEKMTEELTLSGLLINTAHPKIYSARENGLHELEIASALRDLREALVANDEALARQVVYRWVEGFAPPEALRRSS